MGIIVKLIDKAEMIVNGDSIIYAENGNVLEILNEEEEILAVYRNWEYAMVQESEEEYQRSLRAELDDEDDEDLEEFDEDLEEEDDLEEDSEEESSPSPDEEQAVQRARDMMAKAIAEHQGLPSILTTLEQFDENAARSETQS